MSCARFLPLTVLFTLGEVVLLGSNACAISVVPSQSGGSGATFDLQSFVNTAIAIGESTIVLPPGRHLVAPTKGVHLTLRGLKGIKIVANGAELVCTQTTRAITIEDCHGLELSGLSIDYDPLPFTQGRIVNLSADKRVHEIDLLDGYPDASDATTKKYQVFRSSDHGLRWVDHFDPKVEALSPRRLRVIVKQSDPTPEEEVGDLIVIGSSSDGETALPHAVVLESCSDVRLERVTVYASNCFAFLEKDCDRSVYDRCRVAKRGSGEDPVPRAVPRLRSANADGFHSKRATTGPQIVGCYAHYQGDDCVNINGDYHLVAKATGKRLRVIAKQSMDIRVGDLVEVTESDGAALPKARVVGIENIGSLSAPDRQLVESLDLQSSLKARLAGHSGVVYRLTLDRTVSLSAGSVIAACNRRGDGFLVANCDFGHVRSRGIIAKASHGEIHDNQLTDCRGESIKVAAKVFWLESGSASNVSILRNTITGCGSVAIAVYAKGVGNEFASSDSHRQITISDNRIARSPLPNVFVSSTQAVRLERNESTASGEAPPSDHSLLRSIARLNRNPSLILLHHCNDVVMQSNTIQ